MATKPIGKWCQKAEGKLAGSVGKWFHMHNEACILAQGCLLSWSGGVLLQSGGEANTDALRSEALKGSNWPKPFVCNVPMKNKAGELHLAPLAFLLPHELIFAH